MYNGLDKLFRPTPLQFLFSFLVMHEIRIIFQHNASSIIGFDMEFYLRELLWFPTNLSKVYVYPSPSLSFFLK